MTRRFWGVATGVAIACIGLAYAQVTPPDTGSTPPVTPVAAAPAEAAPATEAAPAPPPPPAPAAEQMMTSLLAYAAYHSDVSWLKAKTIASAEDIDSALDTVSHHNAALLVRGWMAYGAHIASQSPDFVGVVRQEAATLGRDHVVNTIVTNRSYARRLAGGTDATRLILNAAIADSARIVAVGDHYQEMAYALQRQRWANAVAAGQPERLARVRSLGLPGAYSPAISIETAVRLSVRPMSIQIGANPSEFGGARFWDAVGAGAPPVVDAGFTITEVSNVTASAQTNESRAEALDRMTSIAALQALDIADSQRGAVQEYLNDPRSTDCVEMARLQLYQCMSAARFVFENTFCLGQHGLREVGMCFGAVWRPDTSSLSPITTPATGAVELAPLEGQDPATRDPSAPPTAETPATTLTAPATAPSL